MFRMQKYGQYSRFSPADSETPAWLGLNTLPSPDNLKRCGKRGSSIYQIFSSVLENSAKLGCHVVPKKRFGPKKIFAPKKIGSKKVFVPTDFISKSYVSKIVDKKLR